MSDLKKKINLQIDEYYENFCDVLHDNIIGENHLLISPGEKKDFGIYCRLQMLEIVPIDALENHDFLSKLVKPWGWDVSSLDFVHTRLFLHMQAEENIKIDIIWSVEELSDPEQPFEYVAVATFFEDNEGGGFGDGPNFDPAQNDHWDEFLYCMGIGPDPYPDLDE
jgi:hypothetical protein